MSRHKKQLPKDWVMSTVGASCSIRNDLREPISVTERGKIQGVFPYYGPTGILGHIDDYKLNGKFALIGEDGDHFLKYKDRLQTLLIEGQFNVNNHAHVIEPTEQCSAEWFYYYFQHRNIKEFLTRQGAGRYKLNKDSLERLSIVLPPLPEQERIVGILSMWDEAIAKTQSLIEKKESLKKLFCKIFFSEKNTSLKIGDIAEVKTGATPSRSIVNYWENGTIPWMSSGEVNKRFIYKTKELITEEGCRRSNTSLLPINTIMIALNGQGKTRGTVAILKTETTCNQSLAGILPNPKKYDSTYLYYFLDSRYQEIRNITGDDARNGLNLNLIKSIPVYLPERSHQKKEPICLLHLMKILLYI